jgi:hypothetical protein
VPLALLGRHEALDAIGEEDEPTRSLFLMALKARSAETSATVSTLGRPRCAELLGGREVHEEHHGHLALLGEHLHVGLVHARRDVPVDEAHVVARLVLAHLAEGHAAALEDGVVPTRELLVGEPRCGSRSSGAS